MKQHEKDKTKETTPICRLPLNSQMSQFYTPNLKT
ncbi:MAG: hypothetical protein RL596_2330, partial [Bacteroidota bacterium]